MRHYARPLRATLTASLVLMAGTAVAVGPTLGSELTTATRSPGRVRRSAAINSTSKPDANVFAPAMCSMSALIGMRLRYRGILIKSRSVCASKSANARHERV